MGFLHVFHCFPQFRALKQCRSLRPKNQGARMRSLKWRRRVSRRSSASLEHWCMTSNSPGGADGKSWDGLSSRTPVCQIDLNIGLRTVKHRFCMFCMQLCFVSSLELWHKRSFKFPSVCKSLLDVYQVGVIKDVNPGLILAM